MIPDSEEPFDGLRQRSVEALRNLAAMRENGGDPLPLIVPEGEEDIPLIEKAFGDSVDIRLMDGGKEKCIELAELLDKEGTKRARVLVDRDFGAVDHRSAPGNPLTIQTHAHDTLMDVLLAAPRVLGKVVERVNQVSYREMTPSERARATKTTLQATERAAFNITSIRILNARRDIGLSFNRFPFGVYLQSATVDLAQAVHWVLTKTAQTSLLQIDVKLGLVQFCGDQIDVVGEAAKIRGALGGQKWELIGDHDLLATLDFFLDDKWGVRKLRTLFEAEINEEEVLKSHWGIEVARFIDESG